MTGSNAPEIPVVVDANVWVAAFDPADRWHEQSVVFLERLAGSEAPVWAPDLLPVEVACAIARRTGRPEHGHRAAAAVVSYPGLNLHPLDRPCLQLAIRLGTTHRLRAADAIHLAVARERNARLVSWNRELIERAGAVPPC